MVALADVITHGCNAVRYSVDKEKSEVVMLAREHHSLFNVG